MLSDSFLTGYHATELAGVQPGETVVVFSAGPVGLMFIGSHELPLSQAPEAYKNFDERNDG